MNDNTKISVVMSVFNGENWLKYSVESILNQTFSDFEFIIVDDGSTDSSINILNYYNSIDKRIRIIRKNNTGLADSLNLGINSAKSEWIARIDCDDKSDLTRLEKQYNCALNSGNDVIIGTNCYLIDSRGNITSNVEYPSKDNELKRNLVNFKRFFAHSSAFFHTSIFQKLGGYRIHFERCQDYDLWLRSLSLGFHFICLQEPLVSIRKHKNQISSTNRGMKSILYSTCALTCFYLRKKNVLDPSDIYNQKEFDIYFKKLVILKLNQNFLIRKESIFLQDFLFNIIPYPLKKIFNLFYKYLNRIFYFINNYRRVRIAKNIAKHYNYFQAK